MTKGALTIFTAIRPCTLGKVFKLGVKGLEKYTAGDFCEGNFAVTEFDTPDELISLLTSVTTSQAITASLPLDGKVTGAIVTKANTDGNNEALTRTKKDFGFPFARKGIIILDYDPLPGTQALTQAELWKLLTERVPQLCVSGAVWWCSASSHIYSGDTELQGLRGQRFYIMVADISDTERVGDVLAKRFWLAGHGSIAISKSGQRLTRSVFDAAMFQPARLDFSGGAECQPPLEQRRGMPVALANGTWLDTREAIKDLSVSEELQYERLVQEAKDKAEASANVARANWKAERMSSSIEKLGHVGIVPEQAMARVERTLSAALEGMLLGDFELSLANGCSVTVGHVLDNRERFHGMLTLDPLEPEYANRKVTGKLFLYGASPTLYSFAHGGATYRLRRQPRRLYVQRGGKPQLADEICKVLSEEPDVFLRGGALVSIRGGRVRPLRKQSLAHLIGSRAVFYVTNERGIEMPTDVPNDVVEMVIAVVED